MLQQRALSHGLNYYITIHIIVMKLQDKIIKGQQKVGLEKQKSQCNITASLDSHP